MALTLGDLRNLASDVMHRMIGGSTSSLSPRTVDHAIQTVLSYANEEAKIVTTTGTVATVASTATVNFSTITNFEPWRLIHARIGYNKIEHVSFDMIRDLLDNNISESEPTRIAFETESPTSAFLHAIPSAVHTITVKFLDDITNFTAGTASDSQTINIPDRFLRPLIVFGVPAINMAGDPRSFSDGNQWVEFQRFVRRLKGSTIPAGTAYHRQPID